jgi:hypothetical protein
MESHLSMDKFASLAPALVAGAGIGDLPPAVLPLLIEEGRLRGHARLALFAPTIYR